MLLLLDGTFIKGKTIEKKVSNTRFFLLNNSLNTRFLKLMKENFYFFKNLTNSGKIILN